MTQARLVCREGRLRLKCDGTHAETSFRLSAKRTSPFKSARASVQSTNGSRGVRISGSNAGYTTFRGSVKSTGYPLHSPVSPSLPLPCVTVCHQVSKRTQPATISLRYVAYLASIRSRFSSFNTRVLRVNVVCRMASVALTLFTYLWTVTMFKSLSQMTTSLSVRVPATEKRARWGSHCNRELSYRLQKRNSLWHTFHVTRQPTGSDDRYNPQKVNLMFAIPKCYNIYRIYKRVSLWHRNFTSYALK